MNKRAFLFPVLALILGFSGCDRETLKPDPPAGMTLFGGEQTESGYDLLELGDGSLLLVGSSRSFSDEEDHDIYLAKTSSTGQLDWERTYPAILDNAGNRIIATADGGYLIAGISGSTRQSIFTAYMLKLDAQFEQEWVISHANDAASGRSVQIVNSVYQTNDGGYLLELSSGGSIEVLKTDVDGNLLNRINYQTWNYTQGRSQHLTPSVTGGFYLVTYDYNNDGEIYRLDDDGAQLYGTNFSLPSNGYYPISIVEEIGLNEILVVFGESYGNQMVVMDSTGQYSDTYDIPNGNYADFEQSSDGNFVFCGAQNDVQYGGIDNNIQILKIGPTGTVLSSQVYDDDGSEKANSLILTSNSKIAVVGHTDSFKGNGGTDLALILSDQ